LSWRWGFKFLLYIEDVELYRQLFLDVGRYLCDVFFTVDATRRSSITGLHQENVVPKLFDRVAEVHNFSITVESEDSWVREERDLFNLLTDQLNCVSFNRRNHVLEVCATEEEHLVRVENEIAHEFLQVSVQHTAIEVVSNTATIHSFADKIS